MFNTSQTDTRPDKTQPVIPEIDIAAVVKAAGVDVTTRNLTIDVIICDNPNRVKPTTTMAHVGDVDHWQLFVNVEPRDELSYGATRALNRSIARAVFGLDVHRTYETLWTAIYSVDELNVAATSFADTSPEAVK